MKKKNNFFYPSLSLHFHTFVKLCIFWNQQIKIYLKKWIKNAQPICFLIR